MSNFGTFIADMEAKRQWATTDHGNRFIRRKLGMVRLASEYGLQAEKARWAYAWVLAGGDNNPKHVSPRPAAYLLVPTIPAYNDIPAAVRYVSDDGNAALKRRAQAKRLGLDIHANEAAAQEKRLSYAIRPVVQTLWLYHFWNGDNVRTMRFKSVKRVAGRTLKNVPLLYHPASVKAFWSLAWEMHGNGEKRADAVAYLRALCVEYRRVTGNEHAGMGTWKAIQVFQESWETGETVIKLEESA